MIQSIVQSYDYKKKIGKGGSGINIPEPAVSDAGKALRYVQTGPNTYNVGWYSVREYPTNGTSGQVLTKTGSGLNDVAWQTLIPNGSEGQVLTRYGAGENQVYFADIKQVPTPNLETDYGKVLKTDGENYFWGEAPQPSTKAYHLRRVRCDLTDITKNTSTANQTLYSCVIDEIENDENEWVDFNIFTDETIKGLAFNNFTHFDIYDVDGNKMQSLSTMFSSIYTGTKIAEQNVMSALSESNGAFITNAIPFEFNNGGTIHYDTSIRVNGTVTGFGIQWYTNNSNIYKKETSDPSGIVETINDPYTTGNIKNIACQIYEEDTLNDKAVFYVITQDN